LAGLRQAQQKWGKEFGAPNRVEKEKWEKKADEWIDKLNLYASLSMPMV